MQKLYTFLMSLTMLMLTACSQHPAVPEDCTREETLPAIYPDYTDVTVPANIAPLNFMAADDEVTDIVARFTAADGSVETYGKGAKVIIPEDEWQSMRDASRGRSMTVEVFARREHQAWKAYRSFSIHVADDETDRYISYRLIDPSYVMYYRMNISQRDVTSFDEQEIFNNRLTDGEAKGQCINCHSYRNYKTDNMLFHVRGRHGATVLVVDGKEHAVNLRRSNTISAGVYPSWHPIERRVAFSTDLTHQWFHTRDANKIEVFDTESDLILYDYDRDTVSIIAADPDRLEVFPTWTPDGRWLYYCSADAWEGDTTGVFDFRTDFAEVRYNLYRRSYHDGVFGLEEEVYCADTIGRSCSLPRISPDGRFLAFAEGAYGYFNIWHREADIRVIDLASGAFLDTAPVNSIDNAESYPSWSSNGRWLMCATRRDDGNYSRIVMSYFDGEHFGKAFMLPQRDPEHNQLRMQSYNRPEFMVESVPDGFARRVARLLEQQ